MALKSVVHEGRDIRDYPFEIGSTDIRDVVLTFTDRRSAVRGRVFRDSLYETTRGWVTIFPSDRALWSDYGSSSDGSHSSNWARSGVFEAEGTARHLSGCGDDAEYPRSHYRRHARATRGVRDAGCGGRGADDTAGPSPSPLDRR